MPARDEVKDITWLTTPELKRLLEESPANIHLSVEFYLSQCTDELG
jgi:hypothetical protein